MECFDNPAVLPNIFAGLFALAILVYAVLDGYDLGVGILMSWAEPKEKDVMISSIGPFWDANETWLVLAVGLLLIAFPQANGMILTNLYLPVFLMLIGLILRGVSFDFRAKVQEEDRAKWDKAFIGGSFLTAMAQGYMLGSYVLGFQHDFVSLFFNLTTGVFVAACYCLIGSSWLLMKTEGALQKKAVFWGRTSLQWTALGVALLSASMAIAGPSVFERWFTFPAYVFLAPIPLITLILFGALEWLLGFRLRADLSRLIWLPFVLTAGVFLMSTIGIAYSVYPYIVPGQLLIVDAASSPESLWIILIGALIVLPLIIGYTFFAYKVFHGKTKELSYN